MLKRSRFFLLLLVSCLIGQVAIAEENDESLWEYGLGFGYVHFAQYPSSNQYTNLLLPFPTFQYRGKRVRADDRDGTRAYIYKVSNLSVELSGGGTAPVYSSGNDARTGMPNLPWVINIGPQLVYRLTSELDFRLGLFQATATDFQDTRFSGQLIEIKLVFIWESSYRIFDFIQEGKTTGRLTLEARSGAKEYLETYFAVRPEFANAERNQYSAQAGFIDAEVSYFQSFKSNRTAFYFGLSVSDFSHSANRKSPLHKSDISLNYLMGLTYQLAESKKPSVDESNTDGFIH